VDFDGFSSLIKKLDKEVKNWKIIAMFQNITRKEQGYQNCKIKF